MPSERFIREAAALRLIGRRIKAAREARGLTQIGLSIAMKRTQGVISEWEHGIRGMGWDDAWSLAMVVGKTINQLFGPPTSEAEHQQLDAFRADIRAKKAEAGIKDPPDRPRGYRRR